MSRQNSRQNSQDIFTGEALANPIRNVTDRPGSPSVNSISSTVEIEVSTGDPNSRPSFIQSDRTPLLRQLRYFINFNITKATKLTNCLYLSLDYFKISLDRQHQHHSWLQIQFTLKIQIHHIEH